MPAVRRVFAGRLMVVVVAAYTVLACITLWTLLAHFSSAVPGGKDSDYYQFLWGYWWIGHALAQGQSPLWTDYVMYPHVANLSVHTLAPVWYPVYALAAPLAGGVAAGNLMVLLSYVFTGAAMFAWLRGQLGPGRAAGALAFLGGLAFAFSPYMLSRTAFFHLNLTPLWWYPLCLLLWDQIAFARRLPRALAVLLLGLALWGVWLSDLQYLVWLPFAVGGYGLWTLWAARRGRRWLALIGYGLAALAIMLALAWVYPLAALRQINLDPNEFPPAGLATLRAYSLPISALFGLAEPVETQTLGRVFVWLVWGGVALGLAAALRKFRPAAPDGQPDRPRPGKWFWLALALAPLVLALGPEIVVGETPVPMPYMLLHEALRGQYRVPSRFTGPAAFLLITFLALAWRPLVAWLVARCRLAAGLALAAVGAALLADVGVFQPFPIRRLPDYAIHRQIAAEGGEFVVLDVPVGVHYGWTGIGQGFLSMYYGSVHQRRMVNGTLSRIPYSTLADYINSPLFSWLAGARSPDEAGKQQAAEEFSGYLRDWPVGYVFAYREWMTPAQQNEWIGWLNIQAGLCPAEATADAALVWWRAESLGCGAAAETASIEMGGAGGWLSIGPGWYDPETIGGPAGRWAGETAALRLRLDAGRAYALSLTALGFDAGRAVTLAGSAGWQETLALASDDWREYRVIVPAGALPDGTLWLRHNGANSAQALGLSDDGRLLAAAYSRFDLRAAASP